MNKIPENKTRKRLRITISILYLFQLLFCAWPYYGFVLDGVIITDSVYEMLSALGTGNVTGISSDEFSAVTTILPLNFIFVVVPIIGFFVCILDRERNIKNIVSLLCCLAGVVSILTIVTVNFLTLGSVLALLLYLLTSFLTTISMLARITDKNPEQNKKDIKKEY